MLPKAPRFKLKNGKNVQRPIVKPTIHDCCVLFCYHKDNATTFRHYELFKKLNPHTPIIPVSHGCMALPDTFNVSGSSPWNESNQWRSMDIFFYKWFMNKTITAKRYALIEYDVYPEISLNDYFSDVWDSEVGTPNVMDFTNKKHKHWQWFNEIHKLPKQLQDSACGIVPLATTLISHDALAKVTETAKLMYDVFCELRLGTAIKANGITPKLISKSKAVSYYYGLVKKQKFNTFYHPIKNDGDIDRVLSK